MRSFLPRIGHFRSHLLFFIAALFVLSTANTFGQSGGVKGKVRDQRDRGIPGATIELRQDNKVVKSVRADEKGEFLISGVRSGKYNVSFDAEGYSTGVLFGVEIRDGIRDLGGKLILNVDPGALVLIRGSVFFREGTSITGAKVDLHRVNEDGSTRKAGTMMTNISGDFAFRQPPGEGRYRVTASYKGAKGTSEVVVDNAAIYRTAITLDISRSDK